MNIVMKEGWLMLETVYSAGNEKWTFHKYKPDYVEETFDGKTSTWLPGQMIRIMYLEADNVEVTPE